MTTMRSPQYSRLYSLRSAWTSLDFRIARKFATTSAYVDVGSSSATSRRVGAGCDSSPMYSITRTLSSTRSGFGTRVPASSIRTRFLYSFWAQAKIVGRIAFDVNGDVPERRIGDSVDLDRLRPPRGVRGVEHARLLPGADGIVQRRN